MRISESAASLTARLCGTTMSPGLVLCARPAPQWPIRLHRRHRLDRRRSRFGNRSPGFSANDRRNNDLIEVGVGLEPDRLSARVWSLPLGVGQLLVEHRIGLTARLTLGTKVTLPSLQVAVHFLAVRQVERDGPGTPARGSVPERPAQWFRPRIRTRTRARRSPGTHACPTPCNCRLAARRKSGSPEILQLNLAPGHNLGIKADRCCRRSAPHPHS